MNDFRALWLSLSRQSAIWILLVLLPIFPTLLGGGNFVLNQGTLSFTWESLWTQHILFLSILFAPALFACWGAIAQRQDHLHDHWRFIQTLPWSAQHLVFNKWLVLIVASALFHFWIGALFITSGTMLGLGGLPKIEVLIWLAKGWFSSFPLLAFGLCVARYLKSFALTTSIAFILGLIGIGIATQIKDPNSFLLVFFPWTLYSTTLRGDLGTVPLLPFILSVGFYSMALLRIAGRFVREN